MHIHGHIHENRWWLDGQVGVFYDVLLDSGYSVFGEIRFHCSSYSDFPRFFGLFLRYAGLSLLWPLPVPSTGSGRTGSAAMAHRPSRSAECGIFPDQGTNLGRRTLNHCATREAPLPFLICDTCLASPTLFWSHFSACYTDRLLILAWEKHTAANFISH